MTEFMTIAEAIEELEKYYIENGKTRSMEYAYGFFDAVSVLRVKISREKIR